MSSSLKFVTLALLSVNVSCLPGPDPGTYHFSKTVWTKGAPSHDLKIGDFEKSIGNNITLVGGGSNKEGNVLLNGKPICDDKWDDRDAKVVCRMLGFSSDGAFATTQSQFGLYGDDFLMDDVQCKGAETDLNDCYHRDKHNCGAGEGAGVRCRVSPFDDELKEELKEIRDENKELQTKLGEIKDENKELQTKLGEIKNKNKELQTKLGEIKDENKEQQTELGEIKDENKGLQTTLTAQRTKLNALETAVSSQETKLDGLSYNLTELRGTVGWLKGKVIQRRGDFGEPREDFRRDWADYKNGFGDLNKEFWLGNDQIHQLTKSGDMKLRVELEAWDGKTAWAEYDTFRVEGEGQGYKLHIGGYTGTAGDSMAGSREPNNGMKFSTRDRDNDKGGIGHCAQTYKGGWWFNVCGYSRLNGVYYTDPKGSPGDGYGIIWPSWLGWRYSLKSTTMMIKSKEF